MTTTHFDVLYLGSGHAAFDGAGPLALTGQKVGVIEADLIGGTCPNRGCNAKIALDEPVVIQRAVERLQGLTNGTLTLNWSAMVAHKQAIIDPLPDAVGGKLEQSGATIIRGYGRFVDAHTIAVGDETYTADKIVIATGARPHRLAIPGDDLAHDSSDFMNLTELPARIAIWGSGYIAMEFATIAQAAGAEVTVMMHGDKALRGFHQPFVEDLIADMTARGVRFIRSANIQSLERVADGFQVNYGANERVTADWVLDATGRIPNVEDLGLEAIGVEYNANGVVVDDHLQTTVPDVYASGDVLDKHEPKLTPTATFESYYLYQLFAGLTDEPIRYPAVPTTVYTSPRIARVGVQPEQAESLGAKVVHNHVPDDWYRQIDVQTQGDSLLVFDAEHRLLGVTEYSEQATDAVNALLPAVVFGFTQQQMWQIPHLFPSIAASAWHKAR